MKLKNFIEVNVDENAYNSEGALIFENPQRKAYINTKHISEFSDNVIWTFGNIKTKVIETSEQIQQKIFECHNDNVLTVSNCNHDDIENDTLKVREKEFRDYLNK